MSLTAEGIISLGHWDFYTAVGLMSPYDENGQLQPDIDRQNCLKVHATLPPGHPLYQLPELSPRHPLYRPPDIQNNPPATQHREIRICDFPSENLIGWFDTLENEFLVNNVTGELEKCQILLRHLDLATVDIMKDYCLHTLTYNDMKHYLMEKSCCTIYFRKRDDFSDNAQELKNVLRYYCKSSIGFYSYEVNAAFNIYEEYIQQDLKSPSQLWIEMTKEDALRHHQKKELEIVWFFLLPYEIRNVLKDFKKATINELVECADLLARNWEPKSLVLPNQLMPHTPQPQTSTSQIQELEIQNEATARPLKKCFYHKKFGRKARKCKAPCIAAQCTNQENLQNDYPD